MLGNAEREQITELCRRYCAVNASEGQLQEGYFRIDGGDGRRRAKKCAANVSWGEFELTQSELLRRVGHAVNEHPHVFVRAIPKGETHAADTLHIEGDPTALSERGADENPTGPHAASEALARVALGQMRMVDVLTDKIERLHGDLQESSVAAMLYQYHAEALTLGSKSELLNRAVEQIGPQLAAQLPQLAAIFAAYSAGQPIPNVVAAPDAPPEEPAEAIPWAVERILSSAVALEKSFGAASAADKAAALPHLARLRDLVHRVAPLVGLQVSAPGAQAAPPSSEGS